MCIFEIEFVVFELKWQMEDANSHSGAIGTSSTPAGSPAPVLMDEDSPGTPSSINTQNPSQSKK